MEVVRGFYPRSPIFYKNLTTVVRIVSYKPTKFHQTLQGLGDFAAATAAEVMSLEEGSGNLRGCWWEREIKSPNEYDFPIQKI